ncbi:MAG TPA: LysE family transporter [Allosphingosinicella sp.]|nr:LysE family transporter [Allosphingosinicella sp.]
MTSILPIFVMFCVWGLKPGPHTITLLVRTVSHGPRTGLAIALGNNTVHLVLFWFAFAAVSWAVVSEALLNVIGIVAGFVIVITALLDNITSKELGAAENVQGFWSAVAAGSGVALANPLNLTFYLALIPELARSRIDFGGAITITVGIYLALLLGQGFYIGLANTVRSSLEDPERYGMFTFISNILFALLGIYVVCRSAMRLLF